MQVSAIKFNLNGKSCTSKLGPLTMIVGRNDSGKTSHIIAMELALLGYSPRLGRQPGAIFTIASGSSMNADVELSNGSTHSYSLQKNGKEWAVSSNPCNLVPAVALDPREYFSLSAAKRRDYVFSLYANMAGNNPIDDVLFNVRAARLEITSPDLLAIFDRLVGDLKAIKAPDFTAWATEAQTQLKAQLASERSVLKELDGMLATHVKSIDGAKPHRSSAAVKSELATHRKTIESLNSRISQLSAQMRGYSEIVAHNEAAHRRVQSVPEISKCNEIIEASTAAIESAKSDPKYTLPLDHEAKMAAAALAVSDAVTRGVVCKSSISKLQVEVKALSAKLAEIESLDACPYCKGTGESFKDRLRESYSAQIRDLSSEIDSKSREYVGIQEIHKTRESILADLRKAKDARDSIEREIAHQNTQISNAKAWIERRTDLLKSIRPVPESPEGTRIEIEKLQGEMDGLRAVISTLEVEYSDSVQAESDAVSVVKATERRVAVSNSVTVTKVVLSALSDSCSGLVTSVFASLMKSINSVAMPIVGELFYVDGEIGIMSDGKFVPQTVFGGTFQAVTFAALAVALSKASGWKVVVLDEMGRLDTERKAALISRLRDLIKSGDIDQFIGIDVRSEDYSSLPEFADGSLTIVSTSAK